MTQFISSRVRFWLLLITLFLIGMGLGFISGQFYTRQMAVRQFRQFQRNMSQRPRIGQPQGINANNPIFRDKRFIKDLTVALDLTPEQQEKIRLILEERKNQVYSEVTSGRVRMRKIHTATHKDLMGVLKPEQKEKFKKFIEKRRPQRRPEMEEPPGRNFNNQPPPIGGMRDGNQ